MKFWFCEKCGKRITDEDLAAGEARDKAAKGMFCRSCSVGVVTVQMEAINLETIEERPAAAKATEAERVREAAPAPIRLPEPRSTHRTVAVHRTKNSLTPLYAGAGAFALSVLAFLVLSSGSSRTPATPGDTPPPKRVAQPSDVAPTPPPIVPIAPTPPPVAVPDVAPAPAPVQPDEAAAAAFATLKQFDGIAETDVAGRIAKVEAFLTQFPGTKSVSDAQALLDSLKKSLAEKPPEPEPPQPDRPPVAPTPTPAAIERPAVAEAAFLQDDGADGLVVIEAENCHAKTDAQDHRWTLVKPADSSGSGAMAALPAIGKTTDDPASAPRMDYRIVFCKTGTHYLWARVIGADGGTDSCTAGLDGVAPETARGIGATSATWVWTMRKDATALIEVPAAGQHTLNVWMREDGFIIDKLLLTTNQAFKPVDAGPNESSQRKPEAPVETKPLADKGQEQYAAVLKELAPLVKQNRFKAAAELLETKLRDPALKDAEALLKQERSDVEAVVALRASAIESLRAQAGKAVTLVKGDTKHSAVVKGGDQNGVLLALKNGPEMLMLPEQLDAQDVDAYAARDEKNPGEDLRRRALVYLAAGDLSRARAQFDQALAAGAAAKPYLERIDAVLLAETEPRARELWAQAEAYFKAKQWQPAQAAYQILETTYARTKVFAEHAAELKERQQLIARYLRLRPGLVGVYYRCKVGAPNEEVMRRVDAKIDFDWKLRAPDPALPADGFAVSWIGFIRIPKTAQYNFLTRQDDGVVLQIDDVEVGRLDTPGGLDVKLDLTEGLHKFALSYWDSGGLACCQLDWAVKDLIKRERLPPQAFFHEPSQETKPKPAPEQK